MRVKLLGAIDMVDARGEVMDRSETVTLFNDMCILAPATLLAPESHGEPWKLIKPKRSSPMAGKPSRPR